MRVCSSEEIRNLDRRAVEKFGITEDLLMENAGNAAYFVVLKEFGVEGKRFVVFCGVGNNGGDGLVVARRIHSSGGEATVFILGDEGRFKGAAKKNREIIAKMPIETRNITSLERVRSAVFHSDAIVDAIFGTGLARNVEGLHGDVIRFINEGKKPVFSIDTPSGINADTGNVMGDAVKATYTVTFGLPKRGLLLYPGYDYCGKLYVSHISYPVTLRNDESIKTQINDPSPLPERKRDSHKGDYGKALFIAGSPNYMGAPYLSALSFLKAGGGLSYLAAPKSISPFLANKGSELVLLPQEETATGSVALKNAERLLEFTEQVDIVIMGPGLSLHEETQQLVRDLAPRIQKPLLIDGDGITATAKDLSKIETRTSETILTPHLGEMSRLAKLRTEKILDDKISFLQKFAEEQRAITVLKGAHTLVAYPDGSVFINMSGNPGMATAGSGDVLTGTVAAMYGQGLPLPEAVRTGVFLHGFAGDLAAREIGEDGLTAQDVLDYLPRALSDHRANFGEITANHYDSVFTI